MRYKVEQKAAREYKVEGEGMMRTEREEMEAAQEDEANIITRSPSTLGGLSPIMFVRYAVYHGKDFTLLDVVRWLIRMRENTVIIVALEHGMFNIRVGERSWNGTSSPLMDLCVWIKDHWVHYASVTPREDCREYRAH